MNDHLDYFGTIARQVSRLTGQVAAGELALAPIVAADPAVAALLAAREIEPEVVALEQVRPPLPDPDSPAGIAGHQCLHGESASQFSAGTTILESFSVAICTP